MYQTINKPPTESPQSGTLKQPADAARRLRPNRHFTQPLPHGIIKNENGTYILSFLLRGVDRQHIVIKTKGTCLYIHTTKKDAPNTLSRQIVHLPVDADTNFGCAKLENEVLTVCISQMRNRKKTLPG